MLNLREIKLICDQYEFDMNNFVRYYNNYVYLVDIANEEDEKKELPMILEEFCYRNNLHPISYDGQKDYVEYAGFKDKIPADYCLHNFCAKHGGWVHNRIDPAQQKEEFDRLISNYKKALATTSVGELIESEYDRIYKILRERVKMSKHSTWLDKITGNNISSAQKYNEEYKKSLEAIYLAAQELNLEEKNQVKILK